jgi:hypothetical protein
MPEPADDPLERLRDQIHATEAAARALAGDAAHARERERSGGVPPAGWATPEDHARRATEVQELAALLAALRDLVPSELEQQLREVVRQMLLLVRALVDWWVQRIGEPGSPAGGPRRAEARDAGRDIPID